MHATASLSIKQTISNENASHKVNWSVIRLDHTPNHCKSTDATSLLFQHPQCTIRQTLAARTSTQIVTVYRLTIIIELTSAAVVRHHITDLLLTIDTVERLHIWDLAHRVTDVITSECLQLIVVWLVLISTIDIAQLLPYTSTSEAMVLEISFKILLNQFPVGNQVGFESQTYYQMDMFVTQIWYFSVSLTTCNTTDLYFRRFRGQIWTSNS